MRLILYLLPNFIVCLPKAINGQDGSVGDALPHYAGDRGWIPSLYRVQTRSDSSAAKCWATGMSVMDPQRYPYKRMPSISQRLEPLTSNGDISI